MGPHIVLPSSPRIGSEERNAYIDWVRAASVCVVVLFHSRLYTLSRIDGQLQLTMWDPPVAWWVISWPLMVIPVFFTAGGYGHSVAITRAIRRGTGYGSFLATRGGRLLGPTVVFIGFWALVASIAALFYQPTQVAALTASGMSLLWFITTYWGVTAVAPFMVRLHQWRPTVVFAVLVMLAIGGDAAARAAGNPDIGLVNLAPVWLFAHQLGIAYHQGWFRTWSVPRLVAVALISCGVIVGLVTGLGYPPVAVGIGSIPIANVLPPTFAMIPLAVAQTCALAVFEKSRPRWAVSPRAYRPVTVINALLMTIYLWHVPCIIAVNALVWLTGAADAMPPTLDHLVITVVAVAVVAAVAPLIGRLDAAMVPQPRGRTRLPWAVAAMGVSVVSLALVWRTGVVVNPAAPLSSAGVIGVGLGWILMRHATTADIRPGAHKS